jgi:hypothetical protein
VRPHPVVVMLQPGPRGVRRVSAHDPFSLSARSSM